MLIMTISRADSGCTIRKEWISFLYGKERTGKESAGGIAENGRDGGESVP